MRKTLKIKTVIAVSTLALLTQGAQAQRGTGKEKGNPRQEQSSEAKDDAAKKKALDADYKNALKNIPAVTEKPDPWKTMR